MIPTLVCDFETTVMDEDVLKQMASDERREAIRQFNSEVWLSAAHDMHKDETHYHRSIDDFFTMLFDCYTNANLYYHNLAFDGKYIIDYLTQHGFTYCQNNRYPNSASYICGDRDGFTVYHEHRTYNFNDTLAIIKASIRQLGDMLEKRGIPLAKGETPKLKPHQIAEQTESDWANHYDYIRRDVLILSESMKLFRVHEYFENSYYTIASIGFKTMHNYGQPLTLTEQPFKARFKPKKVKLADTEFLAGYEAVQTADGHVIEKPIVRRLPDDILDARQRDRLEKQKDARQRASETRKRKRDMQMKLKLGMITQREYDEAFPVRQVKPEYKPDLDAPITDEEMAMKINDFRLRGRTPREQLREMMKIDRSELSPTEARRYQIKLKQLNRLALDKLARDMAKETYKGGGTYVHPARQGKRVGCGMVFDIVSGYPWIYSTMPLPGKLEAIVQQPDITEIDLSRLSVVRFKRLRAVCRRNRMPIIKPRTDDRHNYMPLSDALHDRLDRRAYYLPELVTDDIALVGSDVKYLIENYDIYDAEIKSVQYYGRDHELEAKFKAHCDHWIQIKRDAKRTGDKAMEIWSKLMLNSPYGKLGNYDKDYDIIDFVESEGRLVRKKVGSYKGGREDAEVVAASYITSYGRVYLAESINQVGFDERFLYCDTDSMHILGWEIPEGLAIGKELGNWNIENYFTEAVFLKAKTYGEEIVKDFHRGDMSFLETGKVKESEWHTVTAGITTDIPKTSFDYDMMIEDRRAYPAREGVVIAPYSQTIKPPSEGYVEHNRRWLMNEITER